MFLVSVSLALETNRGERYVVSPPDVSGAFPVFLRGLVFDGSDMRPTMGDA